MAQIMTIIDVPSARELSLLQNTAALVAGVLSIALPVGVLLGALIARTDLPGRRFAAALLAALLFIPLYLQGGAWIAGFGLQGSWTIGSASGATPWLAGWRGAVWVHALAAIPWVAMLSGLGFRSAPRELEEETLLVASPWQAFVRVTLPHARPAIGVAALWVALSVVTEMSITDLFQVRTYAEELYTDAAIGETYDSPALSTLPIVVANSFLAIGLLLALTRSAPAWRLAARRDVMTYRLGRWRWPLALLVSAILVVCVGVPLFNLIWQAGMEATPDAEGVTGLTRSWSVPKFVTMLATSPWRFRTELGWSLLIGSVAATAALTVAVPVAGWACGSSRRSTALLLAAALLLALPGPVIGLKLIEWLNQRDVPILVWLYDRSILAPCLAMWLRAFPWCLLVAWFAFRSVPQAVVDAASLDGAGRLAMLWRVLVPQRRGALAAAWLVAWMVAMNDLAASILVVPPGVTTLCIHVFGLLHYGVEDQVAGISLALVAIMVSLGWLAVKLASSRTSPVD